MIDLVDSFAKGNYYNELYAKIFKFHKQHANATTEQEWEKVFEDLREFKTPFEKALVTAIVEELEREFKGRSSNGI